MALETSEGQKVASDRQVASTFCKASQRFTLLLLFGNAKAGRVLDRKDPEPLFVDSRLRNEPKQMIKTFQLFSYLLNI